MRRDLRELQVLDEDIAELRLMSAYRADLAADRTRCINRLRGLLLGVFPALERVLDFTSHGPLVLISGFQTPTAIRRLGATTAPAMAGTARSPPSRTARHRRRRSRWPANHSAAGPSSSRVPDRATRPDHTRARPTTSRRRSRSRGEFPHPAGRRDHHQLDRDRRCPRRPVPGRRRRLADRVRLRRSPRRLRRTGTCPARLRLPHRKPASTRSATTGNCNASSTPRP